MRVVGIQPLITSKRCTQPKQTSFCSKPNIVQELSRGAIVIDASVKRALPKYFVDSLDEALTNIKTDAYRDNYSIRIAVFKSPGEKGKTFAVRTQNSDSAISQNASNFMRKPLTTQVPLDKITVYDRDSSTGAFESILGQTVYLFKKQMKPLEVNPQQDLSYIKQFTHLFPENGIFIPEEILPDVGKLIIQSVFKP